MAVILLVRHGENDWVGKKLAGRLPGVHLNLHGREQAEKVSEVLSKMPIQAIYSSPLERAVETAKPLAKTADLEIKINPGLQEINFGDWQGLSIKQLSKRKLWQTVQHSPEDMVFPNGESFIEAQSRLVETIMTINQDHEEDQIIVCFSHSDSIRLLVSHFLNMKLNDFQRIAISTASVSVIHIQPKSIRVPFVNQIITTDFPSFFIRDHDKKKNHGK